MGGGLSTFETVQRFQMLNSSHNCHGRASDVERKARLHLSSYFW